MDLHRQFPPTIADIARACGVGTSTVSRALNDQGRVKPATRTKVKAAAERLGYVPNPAVSSLVGLRQKRRLNQAGEAELLPVAILTRLRKGAPRSVVEEFRHLGAAHGFRFEHFNTLNENYNDPMLLGRVLRARGFVAILLRRIIDDASWFKDFPWQHFAVVSQDAAFDVVPVPIVRTSQFAGCLLAWRQMRKKGYRRIGAILPSGSDLRVENLRRLGAWTQCQQQVPPEERVPIYQFDVADKRTLEGVPAWVEREHPDALFAMLGSNLDLIMPRLKRPLPAAAIENSLYRYPSLTNTESVNAETVRLINQLVRSSSYGLPPRAVHHVVAPEWTEVGAATLVDSSTRKASGALWNK